MAAPPRAIYIFEAISIKIPMTFLAEMAMPVLKSI